MFIDVYLTIKASQFLLLKLTYFFWIVLSGIFYFYIFLTSILTCSDILLLFRLSILWVYIGISYTKSSPNSYGYNIIIPSTIITIIETLVSIGFSYNYLVYKYG